MITVACVLFDGGESVATTSRCYSPEWVNRLYRGAKRWLSLPFRFVCYTDIPGDYEPRIELRPLTWPRRDYVSLLEPFRDDLGRMLLLGLDTVICGPIDEVASYRGFLGLCSDPSSPRRSNTGVIAAPYRPEIAMLAVYGVCDNVPAGTRPSDLALLPRLPHDQLDRHYPGIYSWSHHRPIPRDACVVYCCGEAKPHQWTGDPFMAEHWR